MSDNSAYSVMHQMAQDNHDNGIDIYSMAFAVSVEVYSDLLGDPSVTMSQMQLGPGLFCMGIHIDLGEVPRGVPPIPVFPTRNQAIRYIMGPVDVVLDTVEIVRFDGGDDAGSDES